MKEIFSKFSVLAANALGHPYTFLISVLGVAVWAASGPSFNYSETWQLVINTGTTIITFLSVFLIQNTQNRESLATQLKLDEILRALKEARNEMIDLENMSDKDLERIAQEFKEICPRNGGHTNEASKIDKAKNEAADQNS
ncbi:MAG: low affinity iron permease family protein [Candidatus Methylacidiphilales bacterium]|nr:low affinity iron permease family protein [Candidatus Methylacidiphilales bacterium]